ncbi:MAG: flagellar hook-basal body complex protein FliE [Spirochaetes bacterium]|nr:flagellar hook-basal body complex protein FliE [Spirochaetota bacterium]
MVSWYNTNAGRVSARQTGHEVTMNTTNPLHYGDRQRPSSDAGDISTSFSDVLRTAINRVNDLEVDSQNLSQQMITEPESVDIHSVMIAAQKAEIALSFTRAVRDEAVRAFRELMNLR